MCTSFQRCDGHSRKIGTLTFVVCMWEERAELQAVGFSPWFLSLRRSSTGEVFLSIRSHVACVVNHRKTSAH